MEKNKNVPKIRFKGFAEEWKSELLDKLANFSKGSGYSKNDLREIGIPIVLYGRLYTQYQIVISLVDTFVTENKGSIISKGNEVIVPASGETAEDIARASAVLQSGVILGGDLNVIYPNEEINSIFLALSISNGSIWRELSKKAQGKSVVHLRNGDLQEVEFNFPHITEQTQIGNYFQNIDKLIEANQSKLDKLKNIKKACLEKMFPKKGATTPEIRFQGFIEEWEEKELGKIVDVTTGKLDANAMVEDGEYDFYTSGINKYKIDIPAFKGPAITIAGNGATVGFMHYADGEFNAYQRTYVLTEFLEKREFVFLEIGNKLPEKIAQEARTGSIPYIVMDMLTDLKINIPPNKEQSQIGTFFKTLDNLINKNEQQLTKLKNIKKACLGKMFVNKEDTL